MNVLIAMPMYNEESDIGRHLEKITEVAKKNTCRVLIVNDGSTDRSAEVVQTYSKKLSIQLVTHHFNQGLSATLNDLLNIAALHLHDNDVLVTMDSDDTHDPRYIPAMVKAMEDGANLIVLSRFRKGSKEIGYPKYKIAMSAAINLLLKIFFPIHSLRDYTTGYRALSAPLVKQLVEKYGKNIVTAKGFAGIAEIILKLRSFDLRVAELPLVYRYDQKQGTSKLRLTLTIKEYLKLIFRAAFGKL